jgi:vancomycin resistance protein YoaR
MFSLNRALGRRTTSRRFVPAPMISGGLLVDSVGGGISQLATTLYNAAFFAGLELIEHSPHSFYISRYPMGREATISWGGPELTFRNDWNGTVGIDVLATDSWVRVRLFSQRLGRRIETETGQPYAVVAPRTIVVFNRSLAPGERRLRQVVGSHRFDVEYTRRVYAGPVLRRRERFRVRYQPQNGVVEVGPPR